MRIRFHRESPDRHRLEVVRADGSTDAMDCETGSYLSHDFLHLALESEARLVAGFWGRLAAGVALAELNDRRRAMSPEAEEVERIVGGLSALAKGVSPEKLHAALAAALVSAGRPVPQWFTLAVINGTRDRLRALQGQWKATPYRTVMEVDWAVPGSRSA